MIGDVDLVDVARWTISQSLAPQVELLNSAEARTQPRVQI